MEEKQTQIQEKGGYLGCSHNSQLRDNEDKIFRDDGSDCSG